MPGNAGMAGARLERLQARESCVGQQSDLFGDARRDERRRPCWFLIN